ncbi:hypothetical protein LJR030_004086 [Rhizobium sp. LjRoot30]|uniref:hypothetical protein n=1 Tax=Rhizobium sp. LjRoot30 TaxID=3342320 RepID=UPI003ECD36D0
MERRQLVGPCETGIAEVIFDGPRVQLVRTSSGPFAPYHPVIVDKFGRTMLEPTEFIRLKRMASRINSASGAYQAARQLSDALFIAEQYNNGTGLPLSSYSDHFLEQLKVHFVGPKMTHGKPTGCRGVTNAVWNANLSIILQFLLFCERKGIVKGVIGLRTNPRSFNIELEEVDPYPVHRLALNVVEPDEVVIPDDQAFNAVLAAREEQVKNPVIRRRDTLLTLVMDQALRRSEAVSLPIDAIPSAQEVLALRTAGKESGISKPVPIIVHGSKTGAVRAVDFPLTLVERLRDFIDDDRPFLRPAKTERSIFVSSQTGTSLHPQSVTNQYCTARRTAITKARSAGASEYEISDIERVHGHVHRHRSVTDSVTSQLEHGIDPLHTMLTVMRNAGMCFETMLRYLHPSQSRRKSVLKKQGRVDQLKDDIVLERLRALDESKLRMVSRKRRSRR